MQASKFHKLYQDTISDCMVLEESIEDIQEENIQLSKALALVQREISTMDEFCFKTKSNGKTYSPAIRKLYYALLA